MRMRISHLLLGIVLLFLSMPAVAEECDDHLYRIRDAGKQVSMGLFKQFDEPVKQVKLRSECSYCHDEIYADYPVFTLKEMIDMGYVLLHSQDDLTDEQASCEQHIYIRRWFYIKDIIIDDVAYPQRDFECIFCNHRIRLRFPEACNEKTK